MVSRLLRFTPERSIITILYGEVSIKQFLTHAEAIGIDNRVRASLTLYFFNIKLNTFGGFK